MTTPTPPEAIPTYNSIHLVNLTPNLSLTQSQLLLQSSECVYDTVKYTETTRAVSDGLLKVNQLNTRLLQHLDKMGKGEAITVTVDRIEQTMSDVNKVLCDSLYTIIHACTLYFMYMYYYRMHVTIMYHMN